jgi:hypothetical protein
MDLLPVIITVSGLVDPLALPLQFRKVFPEAGVAVSVTCSFCAYFGFWGLTVTEPLPDGLTVTVNVYISSGGGGAVLSNTAVMDLLLFIVIVSGLVDPLASPLQPINA